MAILSLHQNTSEELFLAGLREIRVIIARNISEPQELIAQYFLNGGYTKTISWPASLENEEECFANPCCILPMRLVI